MKDATQIVIVLDRSGSMEAVREATIASFNEFMTSQKAHPSEASLFFVQFNTEYQVLFDKPLAKAPALSYLTYQPNGATALYDALGQTIDSIGQRLSAVPEYERPNKVIFVVLTDGLENSSRRYSQQMIADRIERQRSKYSWEFVFLGANQDAVLTAHELNIPMGAAMSFCPAPREIGASMKAVNRYVGTYRDGMTAVFSGEERAAAVGQGSEPEPEGDTDDETGSNRLSSLLSWFRRSDKTATPSNQP